MWHIKVWIIQLNWIFLLTEEKVKYGDWMHREAHHVLACLKAFWILLLFYTFKQSSRNLVVVESSCSFITLACALYFQAHGCITYSHLLAHRMKMYDLVCCEIFSRIPMCQQFFKYFVIEVFHSNIIAINPSFYRKTLLSGEV